LPRSRPALERLLQLPKEGDFWQADHILAVAEGGGDCGLENLQTLCAPCHKLETEKLRSRIRLNGGPTISANSSNSQDIRSVFLKAKSSTTGVTNTKRRRRSPD
jgi:5-methylcytosine-specific restriction endonuclease McrA